MRIAIFGGSFNPPHVAHQMVALYVLETAAIDQLWFVPAFRHPFDKPLAVFDDRLRMCELAARALGPRAVVSDIERRLGGPSRTLLTVRQLQAERPGDELALVIGSDLIAELDTWYGAAELRSRVSLIVVGRSAESSAGEIAGATVGEGVPASGGGVEMPAVSSTAVRRALGEGRDVSAMVPRAVLDYIAARGLYRAETRTKE